MAILWIQKGVLQVERFVRFSQLQVLLVVVGVLCCVPFQVWAGQPELIATIKSDTNLTQFGYRIIPLGDQNNDNYDDFVTWGFQKSAFVFFGGNPPDPIADLRIDSVNAPYNIRDINSDQLDDIVCARNYNGRFKLALFLGSPLLDSLEDFRFGADSLWGSLSATRLFDINSNGTDEIICRHYDQYTLLLYEINPVLDSIPDLVISPPNLTEGIDYSALGDDIISGDFNGDSFADLGVNLRFNRNDSTNGEVWLYWGGPDFDTIPDMKIRMPRDFTNGNEGFGRSLENLGDVNGDGYDDIFAGNTNSSDSLSYIFFGGPLIDIVPDVSMTHYCERAKSAGDINSDGYPDLITSNPSSVARLGRVYIYLGGESMDGEPDYILTESDIPGYQDYWGNDIAGLGDVNGDGVDDFAFSAIMIDTVCCRGVVYIYSGWRDPVDVGDEPDNILPQSIRIYQNYPNPFNPSTTIEFDNPKRQNVSVVIIDILGRTLCTLVDRQFPAGHHSLTWDGTDQQGAKMPSGVYFYRLQTADHSEARKMILLK